MSTNKRVVVVLSLLAVIFLASQSHGSIAGNALQFDGTDDLAKIPDAEHLRFPSGQSFTIELWFNPLGTSSSNQTLLAKRNSTSIGGAMYTTRLGSSHYKLRDTLANEAQDTYPSNIYPLGEWHCFSLVHSVGMDEIRFFVDGQLLDTRTDELGDITPGLDLFLGWQNYGPDSEPYEGLIDEVRFWDIALDDSYIASNYDRIIANPASQSGLIGYWNFDEDLTNQNIFDMSIMSNNGMLGNSLMAGADDPIRIASTAPLVPEPATLSLLALGGLAILRRRKA